MAIAVPALDSALPAWAALLGTDPEGQEVVVSEGVRVAFFGEGPGRIELLEPMDPESPVGRFLGQRGPGIHHLCLRVADLEAALARATEEGVEILPPAIRRGAEGRRVAFLHPRSMGGVLVELSEAAEEEGNPAE